MEASEIPEDVRLRFWSRVAVRSDGECWPWRLSLGSHGYGQIGWQNAEGRDMLLAHRVAWVLTVGPIPGDLTIDHLCRNRRCCNPNHLRLLTNEENGRLNGNAVKTHCKNGHEFTEANTRVDRHGHRSCISCQADRNAQRKAG